MAEPGQVPSSIFGDPTTGETGIGAFNQSPEISPIEKITQENKDTTQKIVDLFNSLSDPEATRPQLEKSLAAVKNIDVKGFESRAAADIQRIRAFALSEEPSKLAERLLAQNRQGQKTLLDELSRSTAVQQAQAFSTLAQRGGAGAGARERLAGQSQFAELQAQQQLRQQGEAERLGILSEDETRKLEAQGSLPGLELDAGAFSGNIQQANQRVGLAKAGALDEAGRFDIAAQDAAQRFRIGGQAAGLESGQGFANEIFAANTLADAQSQFGKGGGGIIGDFLKNPLGAFGGK